MLSVFPSLFNFSFFAPTILRLAVALIFVSNGYQKTFTRKAEWIEHFKSVGIKPGNQIISAVGIIELVAGTLLLVGFWAQPAALVLTIISLAYIILKINKPAALPNKVSFYLLLLAINLSLLLTGPGALAFDWPL
ncbi:MAG: DoxX family protein [Candidatus Paceibacterota bacterium]|jgi:uncharacterized membrane protein YphA (DoxX/SURF4 family)